VSARPPTLSGKTFSHLLVWSIVLILFVMLTGVVVVAFPTHLEEKIAQQAIHGGVREFVHISTP